MSKSTLPEKERTFGEGGRKGISAETAGYPDPSVGSKGEYLCYCHRGDALFGTFMRKHKRRRQAPLFCCLHT